MWSLGCIIYELAALHPPFEAQSMDELYKVVIKGIYPKIPSSFSRELKNILRVILKVNPESRPSIQDLYESPIFMKRMPNF